MPRLNIVKNYRDGSGVTKDMLDAAFNSVESFFNTTKLAGDNLQSASVSTALIGDGAVTASKILANAITSAKASSDGAIDANRSVTTDHIKTSSITTAKLADGSVTMAKKVLASPQIASSTGATTSSSTYQSLTGFTATVTSFGKPIFIWLVPKYQGLYTSNSLGFKLQRNGTDIGGWEHHGEMSQYLWIDPVAAGTYTYQLFGRTSGGTITIVDVQLVAYEEVV